HPFDDTGEKVHYSVFLEPLATTALFAPYRLRTITGNLPGVETDSDDDIFMRTPTLRRIQYEFFSEVPRRPRSTNTQRMEEAIPADILEKYLQLPPRMDPKIATLANEITAQYPSILEKASAVEAHLKRNYRYTLELTWDPGEQPIST